MRTYEININGEIIEKDILRSTLINEFKIHTRDLRPVFSLKQISTIARRGKCIIVNFRSIKIIIGADKVYVFNIDTPKISENFIPLLLEKIKSKEKSQFEHLVLDATLSFILDKIRTWYTDLENGSYRILKTFRKELSDENFEKLLHFKKQLSKLSGNVKEVSEIIEDILNDDDEIAELYLTKNFLKKDTEEAESILENYLEQVENIAHRIDELDENIDDTQEILTLKMARLRNEIIRFDLWVSSLTAILGLLAVITGFYGMNIKNHLEQNAYAIYFLAGIMILLSFLSGMGILLYLKKKKIF